MKNTWPKLKKDGFSDEQRIIVHQGQITGFHQQINAFVNFSTDSIRYEVVDVEYTRKHGEKPKVSRHSATSLIEAIDIYNRLVEETEEYNAENKMA